MSLINDALKQAKQSQTKTPPGSVPPPLTPAVHPPSRGGSMWILILAAVLFLVAAILFFKLLSLKHEPIPAATNAPALTQTEPAKPQPATSAATNAVEQLPKVQAILFDPSKPSAIVNRKTVHTGDAVGDYKVLKISKNSITFQRADGSTEEIKMGGQ